MGYYTNYSLEVKAPNAKEIIEKFRDKDETASYAFDEYGNTEDSCKWYNHEDVLRLFSLDYPEVLFILSGEGEEFPDLWKLYVKNGNSHRVQAKITYPEPDMEALNKGRSNA